MAAPATVVRLDEKFDSSARVHAAPQAVRTLTGAIG